MPCAPRMAGCHARCLHRQLVEQYRDARDQRDSLRESAVAAPSSVPGTAHTNVAMHQLTDDEFDAHVPPVLFKQWLVDHAKPREQ